jgi:hypothetical protein
MRQTGPIVSWVADCLHTNLKNEVEVERAGGHGCLARSVKLARLVRCFSCLSAEPVTIALTSDFLLALNSVKERGSQGALRSQLLLGLVSAQLC